MKKTFSAFCILFSILCYHAKACMPIGVPNLLNQAVVGNNLLLDWESTTIFVCTGYSIEVEIACLGNAFTGIGPFYTTPNFDKVVAGNEAYPQHTISLAGLCPGQVYQFRAREAYIGLPGMWTSVFNFTAPGVFVNPAMSLSSFTNYLCAGDSTQLNASIAGCGPGPYNYVWDPPTGLSCTNCPNPMASPSANTTYTCRVDGGNQLACWSSSATIDLEMNPASSAGSISSNSTACAGGNLTLTLNQMAPYFQWESSTDAGLSWQVVPAQTNSVYVAGPLSTDDCYRVLVFGCNATYTSNVNCVSVFPVPQVLIMSADSVVCEGQSTDLTAFGADTYTWNNSMATGSVTTVAPTTTTTYSLYGTSASGCSNSTIYTQLVTICNSLSDVDHERKSFFLYPNPNSGNFRIEAHGAMDILILNQLGSCIKRIILRAENNYSLNCDELASGMYFIIDQQDLSTAQKLIINR